MGSRSWQAVGSIAALLALTSCFTPAKERQLQDDIFSLQSRLQQVEASMNIKAQEIKGSEDNANQRIAYNLTQMERLTIDIQKMQGDIDALRVGVVTGQLPGTDPESGSVAKTLSELMARLEVLESNQAEIITAIKDATGKKVNQKKKDPAKEDDSAALDEEIKGYPTLKKAFDGKRYTQVADAASKVVDDAKKKDEKEEALYIWAESLYKLGKLRDAALKYNDLVEMFPKSGKVPHSKMRMGDCFRHLGDKATAKLYYEDLVASHPKAPEAKKAKERLTKL